MDFHTKAVHFQNHAVGKDVSKTKPIYQTSAFSFKDLDDMEDYFKGNKNYLYTRYSNPNTDDLGTGIAQLEEAEDGVATSSGMSAILCGVLSVLGQGDHMIAAEDIYGGTYQLFANELSEFGIDVSFVSFDNLENIEAAINDQTKLIYTESITNPLLRVENIKGIVSIAKRNKLKTMVDNTFASPYLIQPISEGVDLVIHSATKYIGGHSDVTAGVLVGEKNLIAKAKSKVINFGSNLSPFEAWLACRGLKTLAIRMRQQSLNAEKLANALKTNENVKSIFYPKSVSHLGNGAVVTIEIADDCDIKTFFKSLDWVKVVPTLAGVETTVSYPIGTSHRTIPTKTRDRLGITKGLVRISLGIEDSFDIIEVFERALKFARG